MKPLYGTFRLLLKGIGKVFYRHQVYGVEHIPKGAMIIAATHTSYLDPVIVGVAIPEEIHYLAKKELFETAFLKRAITHFNAHPVSGTVSDLSSFKLLSKLFKKDKKVLIFPEGMRTLDGDISEIKPGIGMLALRNKCKILPVYIHGAYEIWPVSKRFPKPFGRITTVIGLSIDYADFSHLDKKRAQEEIAQALDQKLHDLRRWYLDGAKGSPP